MLKNMAWFERIRQLFEFRNFRLFFIGDAISLLGSYIQGIANVWLVYDLTNSAFLLALVQFSGLISNLTFAPFGGIMADQINRHRIILVTETLCILPPLALAALTLTDTIQIWHIIILDIFKGIINAFYVPARHSLFTEMVEKKEYLGNAIAFNSSIYNATRFIGPAIGGLLVAAFGVGICFLIDALSFIPMIIALSAMNIKPSTINVSHTSYWEKLKEGFVYASSFPPSRAILTLLGLSSFMGMSYAILVPVFAEEILHGDAKTLGFLMSSSGIGALIAAIYLSSRHSIIGLENIIAFAPVIFGSGLIAFSFFQSFWLSSLMLLLIGFGLVMQVTSSNTVLQILVDDDKRGRLMSFFSMVVTVMASLGGLFVGGLATHIGVSMTLRICGFFCVLGSFLFYQKTPMLRHFIEQTHKA